MAGCGGTKKGTAILLSNGLHSRDRAVGAARGVATVQAQPNSAHIQKALHCAWMLCQGRKPADLPAPQHHTHSTSAQERKRRKNTSAENPSPPHGVPTCRRHAAGDAHPASATRRRQRRPSCGAADTQAVLVRPAAFAPPHTRSQVQASTWDYTHIQTAAQGRHSASGCAQISAQLPGIGAGAGRGAGSTHCLLRCSTAPNSCPGAAAAHLAALLGCTRELCWRKGSTAERRRDAAARRPCILLPISGVGRCAAGLQKTFPVVPALGRDGRAQVSTFCRRTASTPPIRVVHTPFDLWSQGSTHGNPTVPSPGRPLSANTEVSSFSIRKLDPLDKTLVHGTGEDACSHCLQAQGAWAAHLWACYAGRRMRQLVSERHESFEQAGIGGALCRGKPFLPNFSFPPPVLVATRPLQFGGRCTAPSC